MAVVCGCLLVILIVLLALLGFALSIAEIVMGGKYLNDCPVQNKIPIYLVVSGSVGLFLSINNSVKAKEMRASGGEPEDPKEQSAGKKGLNGVLSLLSLFSAIWFICGMVWIFGTKPTFVPPMSPASNWTTAQPVTSTTLWPGSTAASVATPVVTYCYEPLYKFAMGLVLTRLALIVLNFVVICCTCCGALICGVCLMTRGDRGEQVPQQEPARANV